ncbi:uncharacterized protein LOC121862414 [Homarus americanus]|uniref:Uncharacterized protein n=1 Tax=Homarus americanus TaxID=6706 RepID=A0A8J5T2A1_HOMAM|nr:uncharacterized protein LOC121862414 [Homarus americanus]KAG7172034.1 hypothetical protein Hamer_G001010 [Homarus americanus]
MEIYHLVSWSPHSPLLVGPLPQHPTQLQDLPKLRERPQQTSSEPVGPSLFFPPQRPVLIIGPLPKPLQPARNQRDQMAPDLTEESLLGVSPDNLMPFPSSEFLQGPAIQDLSQIQPPEVLQDEILNTILQSTLEDVLQESVTPVLNNPDLNITLELFNETLQGIDLQTELPQPTLEDDYQDLQQGLRQTVMQIAVPETTGQPEGFTSTPLMVLSLTDNTSTSLASDNVNSSTVTILQQPTYNISFNAFSQVLSENSRENLTEKRQNNSQTTFSTVKSETTTQIPSTTITNTTTISQSSVPSTSLPVSSSGRGTSRTDQENDTAQSATFFVDKLPPVPPLTYLPVGDKRYDIPIDVFSQLPQEFIPFV